MPPIIPRTCAHCGELYQPTAKAQAFCSERCRKHGREKRRLRRRALESSGQPVVEPFPHRHAL